MGLLNNLINSALGGATGTPGAPGAAGLQNIPGIQNIPGLNKLANKLSGSQTKTYTFQAIPRTLEEFKALPEAVLTDEYAVAALSVIALTRFTQDRDLSLSMLNFLKGPQPLSNQEIQMISDRFMDGKTYKVSSFFVGATPANNYTPSRPFQIQVSSNPYSFTDENWATLYLGSGGADNPRPVRLRKKPSTGQWFLVEIQYLGDIRTPVSQDPWA